MGIMIAETRWSYKKLLLLSYRRKIVIKEISLLRNVPSAGTEYQSRTHNNVLYFPSTQTSHTRQTHFHPSSAPPPPHVQSTSCGQMSVLEELKEAKRHQVATEDDKSTHICAQVYQDASWTFWVWMSQSVIKNTKSEHRNPWKSMTAIPLLLWRLRLSGKTPDYILQS